jgi:type II secretory pathway pseudopilin PulG
MKKRFWKGLRIIDLVIVLSIICMVLSVVAGRYPDFKCRAIQSEAKFSLQEIYAAQMRYHQEHDHYATIYQLLEKDQRVKLPQKYYDFKDQISPSKDNFSILAIGRDNTMVVKEKWVVNEYKEITVITPICKKSHEY